MNKRLLGILLVIFAFTPNALSMDRISLTAIPSLQQLASQAVAQRIATLVAEPFVIIGPSQISVNKDIDTIKEALFQETLARRVQASETIPVSDHIIDLGESQLFVHKDPQNTFLAHSATELHSILTDTHMGLNKYIAHHLCDHVPHYGDRWCTCRGRLKDWSAVRKEGSSTLCYGDYKLVIRSYGYRVDIKNKKSSTIVHTLEHPTKVHSACWSVNGEQVATLCAGNQIHIWNARTGECHAQLGYDSKEGEFVVWDLSKVQRGIVRHDCVEQIIFLSSGNGFMVRLHSGYLYMCAQESVFGGCTLDELMAVCVLERQRNKHPVRTFEERCASLSSGDAQLVRGVMHKIPQEVAHKIQAG